MFYTLNAVLVRLLGIAMIFQVFVMPDKVSQLERVNTFALAVLLLNVKLA
jgi:hypothetical protein